MNSPNSPQSRQISLTTSEQRLIVNTGKYRPTVFSALVILSAVCYIWFEHFDRFTSNPFFLAYNVIAYVALICAAFATARYQWRIHQLLRQLQRHESSSSTPDEQTA